VRTVILMSMLLLLALPAVCDVDFQWEQGPEMPSGRDHLGCGMVNGLFVVAGGAYWKDGKKCYNSETIAYSPQTGKWIRLPHLPRPGAYGASAVMHDRRGNDQLLIAGGANADGATSACYRLMKLKGVYIWKALPDLPRPLAGAEGAVVGNKFYVFGGAPGMDEAGIRSARPTLLELEVPSIVGINSRWKEISVAGAPSERVGSAVAASDGRLFVFGGYGVRPDGTLGNFSDAYTVDLSRRIGRTWRRIQDMPTASRWTTALALDRHYVGLFAGYGETPAKGFLDKVFVYDVERDDYAPCAGLPQAVAVTAGGIASQRTVYLAGGEDQERHRSASLFIGRWKPMEAR